jgi:YidC/Oxa1 family membrane protein insertase
MSERADTPRQVDRAASTGGGSNRLAVLTIAGIVGAIVVALAAGVNPWQVLFINPLINILILFDNVFFNQFGLAIIAFTLAMRLITLPLTVRQFQSTKAMQSIQPRVQELQKKYKDPKRRQEETMKMYREAGLNPLGCVFPMLIQMPIWIALYRALIEMVGGTPERLVDLSQRLYPWSFLSESVPLNQDFLWLDLGQADATFILPILVGITTYVTQKLTTTQSPASNPQQQQMTSMMTWMMPIMFVWITLQVPSGLGLYWVMSNVASFFISLFVYGRKFSWRQVLLPMPAAAPQQGRRPAKSRSQPQPDATQSTEAEAPTQSGPEKRSGHERRRRRRRGRRKDHR